MVFLPKVTRKNQIAYSWLVGFITVAAYAIASELALQRTPMRLPLLEIDQAVPFVPATFWIYSTVYFIFLTSCALQRDMARYARFLVVYVFAYVLGAAWFCVVPSEFPRELYPITEPTISGYALELFRKIDHPTNCLPSMHVASAVMSTLPLWGRRPRLAAFYAVWALGIALATLTTKQHYFVDVIAGAAYGAFCYSLVMWALRHVPLHGVESVPTAETPEAPEAIPVAEPGLAAFAGEQQR